MKIVGIVGTRPNFVKMAPVIHELQRRNLSTRLVHTGQHFDQQMSQVFFDELALPRPDDHLGVGQLSPWQQSARIVQEVGEILVDFSPDWVIVPGDVNSTLAAALATIRVGCRLAHLEAGLRSFDRTMPEELNRVATDHLADLLFVTEPSGQRNLLNEGVPDSRICFVGNTMIDTLLRSRELSRRLDLEQIVGRPLPGPFTLVTVHRPSNVDHRAGLEQILAILRYAATKGPVIFPVHPRTESRIASFELADTFAAIPNLILTPPLSYLAFLALMDRAQVVLTDSGGIQEETTVLGTICLTLRENTERPVTCSLGTNQVVGTDPAVVTRALDEVWQEPPAGRVPEGWDGNAAARVVDRLLQVVPVPG